jgi:uncharacterized damage-inducible protein DinB
MLLDHIRRIYEYNYWCNQLIMDTAEKLSDEQFDQQTQFPINTLKETLVHTMSAERVYRMRLAGESPSGVEKDEFAGLQAIRDFWAEEEKQMMAYLDGIDDAAVAESFKYTVASTGKEYERVRADILTQLLFHGMQHRAEMAQMLTEFGHSPGNIDYLIYINDR